MAINIVTASIVGVSGTVCWSGTYVLHVLMSERRLFYKFPENKFTEFLVKTEK